MLKNLYELTHLSNEMGEIGLLSDIQDSQILYISRLFNSGILSKSFSACINASLFWFMI